MNSGLIRSDFGMLSRPVKITSAGMEALLHVDYARLMASHIIFSGLADEPFQLECGSSPQRGAPFIAFMGNVASNGSAPAMPLRFLASLELSNTSLENISFAWPGLRADFVLNKNSLSTDISGIAAHVPEAFAWPLLSSMGLFTEDWHNLLYDLRPARLSVPADAALTPQEREALEYLDWLLPEFNPEGWHAFFDVFDSCQLVGWAKKQDCDNSRKLDFYLNGQLLRANYPASLPRPDVRAAGFGTGDYGFHIPISEGGKNGDVQAFAIKDPDSGVFVGFHFFYYSFNNLDYKIRFDSFSPDLLGWCITKDNPARIVDMDIHIDGAFYATVKNDLPRRDLEQKGLGAGKGGFQITSPVDLMPKGSHEIRVDLWGGRASNAVQCESSGRLPILDYDLSILSRPVAIVIPCYNRAKYEDSPLRECLERLFLYTPLMARVIIVDDCSPVDPGEILAKFSPKHEVAIIRNPANMGFSASVNNGLRHAGDDDAIILNEDARVTPGWLRSMLLAATTMPRVASVTAMSDRAGAFSAPERGDNNILPADCAEADFARAFRRSSFNLRPEAPTGNGFCMYMSRACIKEIGLFDAEAFSPLYGEENDWCMRALRAGWRNLVDDRTYVFHERGESFKPERQKLMERGAAILDARYPEYRTATRVFRLGDKFRLARFCARLAARNVFNLNKPRLLFVVATQTGGTPRANMDLMLGLAEMAQCYLLSCDSKTMSLSVLENGGLRLLAGHALGGQIEPISHISAEYDKIAANWLIHFDIDLVHIRQLMWHSLNIVEIASELGIKIVYSFHDFYAVNPSLNLLDDTGEFRGQDYATQAAPQRVNIWHRSPYGDLPVHGAAFRSFWKERFTKVLRHCDALVTTAEDVRNIVLEEMPGLAQIPFAIIPHGRDFGRMRDYRARPRPWGKTDILVPGNIDCHKGKGIIESLALYDERHEARLNFHILGAWQGLKAANIIAHGKYKREDMPGLIARVSPHAGAVFSICCETWCHSLTEMWACGIPVFVFDIGTQASRARQSGAGWVLPLEDIPRIYEKILSIVSDPAAMERAANAAATWQSGEGMAFNTRFMASRYYDLYRNILEGGSANALKKRPLVAYGSATGLGTSHLRVIEPCFNDFKRNITYILANGLELLAYASLGLIDAAILQRAQLDKGLVKDIIKLFKQKDIPYIFEMDDDLFHLPDTGRKGLWLDNYLEDLRHLIGNSAKFLVSTPELLRRYGNEFGQTRLQRTRLGARHWAGMPPKRKYDGNIRAFYHGTPTHKEDLLQILPALRMMAAKYPDFRLVLLRVGDGMKEIISDNPFMEEMPLQRGQCGYPDYTALMRKVSSFVDFGIAPLLDSYFNGGKSFIKVIEYAGLGLPAIASAIIPYTELAGFPGLVLAENNIDAWTSALEGKIRKGRKNREVGMEAWEYMQANYIWREKDYLEWDGLFEELLASRPG